MLTCHESRRPSRLSRPQRQYIISIIIQHINCVCLFAGAQVHGTVRRSSYFNQTRLQDPRGPEPEPRRFQTHYADLSDGNSLVRALSRVRPDELYNLGAQSHVKVSFDMPEFTTDVDALGAPHPPILDSHSSLHFFYLYFLFFLFASALVCSDLI